MGRQIDVLRENIRSKFLKYQKTNRYLNMPDFERAYDRASPEQRNDLERYAHDGSLTDIKIIVAEILFNDYQNMSIMDLKRKAKRLNVPYWYRLDKINLIEALEHARRNSKTIPRANTEGGDSICQQTEMEQDCPSDGSVPTN